MSHDQLTASRADVFPARRFPLRAGRLERRAAARAWVCLAALIALLMSAAQLPAQPLPDTWTVEDDPWLAAVAMVANVHVVLHDDLPIDIRLYETLGGDPAINGVGVWLALVPWDPFYAPVVVPTGIDVAAILGIELSTPREIVVTAIAQYWDGGDVVAADVTYRLRFAWDDDYGPDPLVEVSVE